MSRNSQVSRYSRNDESNIHDKKEFQVEIFNTIQDLNDLKFLLSSSGDLGIGLVWDNHPHPTPLQLFGSTVEILFKVN